MSNFKKIIANRLLKEDSPYLLQHAYNPIDWYAWGDEAFNVAKSKDKPIFLSIGYSACHWCHVMEQEVFENEALAAILNECFVCIKVDREERPDIDKHFQHIHHIITRRSGGWPTSIFLTPEKQPFFAATYIPPKTKNGMMGFGEMARMLYDKLKNEPQEVYKIAQNIERVAKTSEQRRAQPLNFHILPILKEAVQKNFDVNDGGILGEPKFPHTALLMTMLESKDKDLMLIAAHTLKCMAKGGMYDVVDGGFCRYSVDSFWLVPHFEKMTYDNGLLIEAYSKAYSVTKEPIFLKIAKECADFMMEKMSEQGLFYSASDADSEGEEGKYFVYDWNEALEALKQCNIQEAEKTLRSLGFGRFGNFERKNIVRNENFEDSTDIQQALKILKELRKSRIYPFIDTKIICSSNAMMITALFELSRHDNSYLKLAKNSLVALKNTLQKNGKLYHCAILGNKPKIEAFLEDYAFLAKAYISGYTANKEEAYKIEALKLTEKAIESFYLNGIWALSTGEFETNADASDGSYTSSIGIMCEILSFFEDDYSDILVQTISLYADELKSYPLYYASMAGAYQTYLARCL